MPRLQQIQEMLQAQPDDVFLNYSLAMELLKTGRLDDALAAFHRVIELDPDYAAAYYHQGKTLIEAKRYDRAKEVLERGQAAAEASGDTHTKDKMSALLDMIP